VIETALENVMGGSRAPAGAATKLGLPARKFDSRIKRFKINKYGSKCNALAEWVPALCSETSCDADFIA